LDPQSLDHEIYTLLTAPTCHPTHTGKDAEFEFIPNCEVKLQDYKHNTDKCGRLDIMTR